MDNEPNGSIRTNDLGTKTTTVESRVGLDSSEYRYRFEFVSPYLTNSNDPEFYDNSYRDDGRVIYKEILAKKEFFFFLMHSCNNYESKYSKYKYSKLLNSQGYDIKGREDYDFII